MRAVTMVTLAVGLIAGFALGGIAPRRELGGLQKRYDKLERELQDLQRPSIMSTLLPRFAQAVDGADAAADARSTEHGEQGPRHETVVLGQVPEDQPSADAGLDTAPRAEPRLRRGGLRAAIENFESASQAQRVRAVATRAALIEQAGLGEEQVAALDASVARMNTALAQHADMILDLMAQDGEPTATQALEVGHVLSGVLLEHQRELDGLVGSATDGHMVEDNARQVWNLVDFEAFRPAIDRHKQDINPASPVMGTAGAPARE